MWPLSKLYILTFFSLFLSVISTIDEHAIREEGDFEKMFEAQFLDVKEELKQAGSDDKINYVEVNWDQ